MEIEGYEMPEELCYTKDHLWAGVEDDEDVRIGMDSSTAIPPDCGLRRMLNLGSLGSSELVQRLCGEKLEPQRRYVSEPIIPLIRLILR